MQSVPTETIVRDFLVEYLKRVCGITIDRNCINLKNTTVELRVSPIIHAKFNPHRELCIEKLNEYLKEKEVKLVIKRIM